MEIVPVKDIPTDIENTPTNLMELFKVSQQMEILCSKEKGIGLSAVQVGIPWRLFVVNESYPPRGVADKALYNSYVDCEYEGIGDKQDSIEGCLSLRNSDGSFQTFRVQRYSNIRVTGKRLFDDGENLVLEDIEHWLTLENDGIYTVVFQHEIDHHHDILITNGEPVQARSVE